jgi:Mg/Co/Ni transporter MgtE
MGLSSTFEGYERNIKLINRIFNLKELKGINKQNTSEESYPEKSVISFKSPVKGSDVPILLVENAQESKVVEIISPKRNKGLLETNKDKEIISQGKKDSEKIEEIFQELEKKKKKKILPKLNLQKSSGRKKEIGQRSEIRSSLNSQEIEENEENPKLKKAIEHYKQRKKDKEVFSMSPIITVKELLCRRALHKNEAFLYEIYFNADNYIREKLDVISFIHLQNEYTTLKRLLLSNIESMCLKFNESPSVIESKRKPLEKEILEIVQYFSKDSELKEADKKCFEMLSDDFKRMINFYKNN